MTEQRRTGKEAAEGELFRLLVENVRDYAIFVVDPHRHILSWNHGAERLLGFSETEIVGRQCDCFFTPEDVRKGIPQQELDQALITGRGEDDRWHMRKDGSRFWCSGVVTPLKDEGGTLRGFAKVMRDRTDLKRAEDQLHEQHRLNARLAALVQSSEDGILGLDLDGTITSWSQGAQGLYGYTPDEVKGRPVTLLVPPGRREELDRALGLVRRGEVVRLDTVRQRRDGRPVEVSLSLSPVRDDGGRVVGAAVVHRDVTERRQAERRRNARLAVTQVLAESPSLREAAPAILRAVCESLGWDVGALWVVDRQAEVLRCLEAVQHGPVPAGEFLEASRRTDLPRNGSLPGRVWHGGVPLWVPNVASDPHFYRASVAARVGLHGAFACPIRVGDEFLGAVEFFSREIREPDADLLEMMTTLAGQVGQFMERRRAEQALRESEARLQAVLDHTPAMVYIVDADGRFLLVNRRWQEVLGLGPDQVVGRFLHDVFPREVADQFVRNNCQVLGAGVPFEFEEKVPHAGEAHTYISVKVPFRHGADGPPAVCGISTDITERKHAEEALRDSEARFRGLMEQAPFSVQVFSPDGRTQRVNRAWEELWGVTLDQIAGYNILEDRQLEARGVLPEVRRAFAGEPVRIPAIRYDPNETIPDCTSRPDPLRWVAAVAYPLKDPDGRVREVVLVHEDITARTQAEQAQRRAAERLRLLWEAATVLLTTDDPDAMLRRLFALIAPHLGLDTYFNFLVDEAGDGLRLGSCAGVPESEVRKIARPGFGQAVCGTVALRHEGIVATHIQESDDPMVQLVKGYGIRAYACHPLLIEGRLLGTLSFASRTRDEFDADELELLRTVSHYVTVAYERLRLVGQLREMDRKKDDFLAVLAHELRNPLAPVRNAARYLRLKGTGDPDLENAKDIIERQVKHLARLVDDLLDVSRITRGKITLRKERLALGAVLTNAVEASRPQIEAGGHELTVSLPHEPLSLEGDLTRLSEVFGNLLVNAAKYTERGGRIRLTARREGSDVVVSVRDTGIGISAEHLSRLFEMFSQVDSALERSQGGLGIGLALVKGLVELHGGSVEARSDGPGRGSEFLVRLPAVVEPPGPSCRREGDGGGQTEAARCRVVVADDNPDSVQSLALLLAVMGHEVRTAPDGQAAVELAAEFRPDLALLDIGMPRLNGYEAARRIREQPWGQGTVLVALTGWGQEEDKRKAEEAGFDRHFTKPVDPTALEDLLAAVAARR